MSIPRPILPTPKRGIWGGGVNLQAIKNSVSDYEKMRTTKTEICLDKIYSSSSSNNLT